MMFSDVLPRHLIIEIVDSRNLNNVELMEEFLREVAAMQQGAILGLQVHRFQPHGLSALMIMPESHVAVHTWPEYHYASIDIFLQGQTDAVQSVPLIEKYFQPGEVKVVELERGVKNGDGTVVHPGVHRKLPNESQG